MDLNDAGLGRVKALLVAGLVLLAMALGYSVGVQGAPTSPDIRSQPEMRFGGAEAADVEVAQADQS